MRLFIITLLAFSIGACSSSQKYSQEQIDTESKKANAFFDSEFKAALERSPMFYTYIGQKVKYDQLNDVSYENSLKEHKLTKESLKNLKKIKYHSLNEDSQLSYRLYKDMLEAQIEGFKYSDNDYIVNQMRGVQSWIPSFMINMHRIDNESDAKAYIARVKGVRTMFGDVFDNMDRQLKKGVKYPAFMFPKVLEESKNIISGKPFDKSKEDAPLYKDFKTKVNALKISAVKKKILIRELEIALKTCFKPAYDKLISYVENMQKTMTESNGVWALPDGKAYYQFNLKQITSIDMTAEQIHKLGLAEVERIHNEMKAIMKKVGFKGNLQDFFSYVKNNKNFFYSSNKKGRAQYLKDTNKIIADMKLRLDDLFITKPKADLVVKAVEPFREKSAGIAFYQVGSLDGKRPGQYYVNLSDMSSVAKYDMEALAYHEAIPGHHMERSMNQEIQGTPMFRKFSGNTAYVEGWGLYSERIPKEIGFYKDPYSDFGRLSMELWRAARLVVDTGIHHYKWSLEKVVGYLKNNTPNSQDEIDKGAQRYFVMPGQATAYKIGQLKILELREKTKKALGEKFDIREFHEIVLGKGALPLYELEKQVKEFIAKKNKFAKR
jgi:uncharacterized protein (DUF885 family)